MFVWRKWLRVRDGYGFFPHGSKLHYEAEFVGLFLFGIIPLYIRQVTMWK